MDSGRGVEGTFGDEVGEHSGFVAAQPVVGISALEPVLGVRERAPLGSGRRGLRGLRGRRGARRGRHGGHRTAGGMLAAFGLLLAGLVPALTLGGPAQGKADNKVVFHVAMLGEGVDSLNTFLGFQAPSYEMWGLTYDYLTGCSMKDK